MSYHDFLSIFIQKIRQLAIPVSSILPFREYLRSDFLEVLFLAELILHEVWPALFEIPHSLDWYNRFPSDWNAVFSENHEQKCRESLLCILTFALLTRGSLFP